MKEKILRRIRGLLIIAVVLCTIPQPVWSVTEESRVIIKTNNTPVIYLRKPDILIGEKYKGKPVEQGFWRPLSGAADSEGNIYILDEGDKQVVVYAPDGRFLRRWGSEGNGPGEFKGLMTLCELYVDSKDHVYILTRTRKMIQIFSKSGKYINQFNLDHSPNSFTVDTEERIYVCNSVQDASVPLISVYNSTGKLLYEFGKHFIKNPEKIKDRGLRGTYSISFLTQDKYGNLCVLFSAFPIIQKYSREGKLLWQKQIDFVGLDIEKREIEKYKEIENYVMNADKAAETDVGVLFCFSIKNYRSSILILIRPEYIILSLDFDGNLKAILRPEKQSIEETGILLSRGLPKIIVNSGKGMIYLFTIYGTCLVGYRYVD